MSRIKIKITNSYSVLKKIAFTDVISDRQYFILVFSVSLSELKDGSYVSCMYNGFFCKNRCAEKRQVIYLRQKDNSTLYNLKDDAYTESNYIRHVWKIQNIYQVLGRSIALAVNLSLRAVRNWFLISFTDVNEKIQLKHLASFIMKQMFLENVCLKSEIKVGDHFNRLTIAKMLYRKY